MSVDTLTWGIGGVATALAAYALFQLRAPKDPDAVAKPSNGEEHTLAEVSRLWTGDETELDFRDIARIWRTTPEACGEPKPTPHFHHSEIEKFHARWAALPVVNEEKRGIIESILAILDKEGDCPSVVRRNSSEAEKKYDPNVFDRLATIPLWHHSLEVANQLAGTLTQAMLIPDALIAGLGHDLGKIPAYQNALYLTGDHPILSLIALSKIPGYETMANRDEVNLSIRQHHVLNPESALGRALKEADHQIRLMEISRLTPDLTPAHNPAEDLPTPKASPKKPSSKAASPPETKKPIPPAPIKGGDTDMTTAQSPDSGVSNLNLDRLLEGLRGKINRVVKNRWSIVSVPEGWVLAHPDALWGEAKRLAQISPAFLAADADETNKRRLLNQIVQRLANEKQAIATELLGDGYFTTQCLVVTHSGQGMKLLLIPFRAEAFGFVPSALEAIKNEDIQRMVKLVKIFSAFKGTD